MTARDRLGAAIAADFAHVGRHLRNLPDIPGHDWIVDPRELRWNQHDIFRSVAYGASIFLRRVPGDPHRSDQVHIEVRLFWNEPGGRPAPGIHRAILWCERGPRFAGAGEWLIGQGGCFLHATTIDALCEELGDRILTALRSWPMRKAG